MITPRVSAQFLQTELAAEMYCDEVLTGDGHFVSLDIPGSVSGLIRSDLARDLRTITQILLPKEGPHGS